MVWLGYGPMSLSLRTAPVNARAGSSRYLGAVLTGTLEPTPRSGYSLVELFFVVSLLGVLLLIALPRMNRGLTSSRVDRAASIVALTLERAFTLASRQRRPVVVACDCPNRAIEIRDLTSGDVYLRRALGPDTDFQVDSLTLSEATVQVSPHGVAYISAPPFTVRIATGTSHRSITMSSAGQVRVLH